MTEGDLSPQEREALELLQSNDPRAAATLAALDDSGRARVLAQLSGASAPQASAPSEGAAASDQPAADGAESTAEVSEEVPPGSDVDVEGDPSASSSAEADDASESESESEADESDPGDGSDAASGTGPSFAALGQALSSTAGRVTLAVVGVAVVLLIIFVARSCGGDGDPSSNALLLVREGAGDLYVGRVNAEIERDDRVVRDFNGLTPIRVTRDGTWWSAGLVDVGNRRVLVAQTQDGDGAWVIEGSEVEELASRSSDVEVVVVGDTLYLRESGEGTQQCDRGSIGAPDDMERVFRGEVCIISYSGHVLGANSSGDSYRVTVWTPQGDETALSRANFQRVPAISQNGRFLVSRDDEGVTVTSVDTGDRVWEIDGGVDFDLASHPDGQIALAVETTSGEAYLVVVDGEGNADDLLELNDGQVVAEFAPSGDLFWLESKDDGRRILSVWDTSERDVFELAEEEGLRMVGVHEGSAVTVIEDDLGALYQTYRPDDVDGTELHEFDDRVFFNVVYGDFLYVEGNEIASVIPISGDEPTDSLTWDAVDILDVSNGLLIAVGTDGSSEVLFSIKSGSDDDVEYGEFDDVVSAQAYGNTLYATVRDGLGTETLAFNISSGDAHDDGPDYGGYRLISNRPWPNRNSLSGVGYAREVPAPAAELRAEEPAPATTTAPAATTTAADVVESGGFYSGYLSGFGDSNRYSFEIPSGGRLLYAETYGQIDVVAEVFPAGSDFSLAYDDDSGTESNAQLEVFLDAGWYVLEVRGYSSDVTGNYELFVVY